MILTQSHFCPECGGVPTGFPGTPHLATFCSFEWNAALSCWNPRPPDLYDGPDGIFAEYGLYENDPVPDTKAVGVCTKIAQFPCTKNADCQLSYEEWESMSNVRPSHDALPDRQSVFSDGMIAVALSAISFTIGGLTIYFLLRVFQ